MFAYNLRQKVKIKTVGFLRKRNLVISNIFPSKRFAFSAAWDIKSTKHSLLSLTEAAQVFACVKNVEKIKGDIAEVGVFLGGSAKLICMAKGSKNLHLFDTFEGLPPSSSNDEVSKFHEKQYCGSLEYVKKYLKDFEGLSYYKGLFPKTSDPVKDKVFCFVHLDVDLYQSTKDALTFFYPRMAKGGLILSHDYAISRGVRAAFDEFFSDKIEPVIEIAENQCLVVKI